MRRVLTVPLAALLLTALHLPAGAQQPPSTGPRKALPDAPVVFDSTARGPNGVQIPGPTFRVTITKGLQRPYAIAFLPDGRLLISERAGRIRIVRDGAIDPTPVSGVPPVLNRNLRGMNDLVLHPKFAENGWVYFTYYRPHPTESETATAVVARGRYDGAHALTDVKDILVADQWVTGPSSAKILFAKDGTLFVTFGIPIPARPRPGITGPMDAQSPGSLYGKILRVHDDGSVPRDNPFVGQAGYRGEIYALGIRNAMGLALHPTTGELWETENGPQGGDELNIIRPGKNYGWPIISHGRAYSGDLTGETGPQTAPAVKEGLEQPLLMWSPSPALTGMTFYTGDRFPEWKGNVFVGSLIGEYVQRIVFNLRGLPTRRDPLMWELGQRIRDVQQGPDGLLYAITDEDEGALLRIEPVAR
ncbi:MAG: PQQ-dependent sugar dehydrogenase [Vicinamibacterales bacterium]